MSASLLGLVGGSAVLLAAAAVWLMLTHPVTLADAVSTGSVTPLVRDMADMVLGALAELLKFL